MSSGARLGRAFASAWEQLQCEIGEATTGSALAHPATEAGKHCLRLQAAISHARDLHAYQRLDIAVRSLAPTDARRVAWLNVDTFSAS